MLHVVLACGSLFTMDLQRFRASPAFLWHTSQAMNIIRKRLVGSVDAPSDETIVAVASIAIAKVSQCRKCWEDMLANRLTESSGPARSMGG